MPKQYGSNGVNSDGSLMNVGNQIWDPSAGGRPSIRLFPERQSGSALRHLLTDQAMGFAPAPVTCLLYTSDAADEEDSVDLGGRRIIKKKKKIIMQNNSFRNLEYV
eukprot:TRINITY_DN6766_c0_g1_i1.p1 TRINITY_DN6766_c0_g1~~TRINITY_DN6766_c0_g1_i1.p1  ORF type:complete len:106 (+),score=22.92 TRINITY_DN6766_c0_g1_i1:259-576(+)